MHLCPLFQPSCSSAAAPVATPPAAPICSAPFPPRRPSAFSRIYKILAAISRRRCSCRCRCRDRALMFALPASKGGPNHPLNLLQNPPPEPPTASLMLGAGAKQLPRPPIPGVCLFCCSRDGDVVGLAGEKFIILLGPTEIGLVSLLVAFPSDE